MCTGSRIQKYIEFLQKNLTDTREGPITNQGVMPRAMVPGRTMDFCLSSGEIAMLAICEECSKKYNIDETKMKSTRARFSCRECGHIIVVVKNTPEQPQETGHKPSVDMSSDVS